MLTSAAPIAPMIAAALPPPGVAVELASASRNGSTPSVLDLRHQAISFASA